MGSKKIRENLTKEMMEIEKAMRAEREAHDKFQEEHGKSWEILNSIRKAML